jgi:hypothetical protein
MHFCFVVNYQPSSYPQATAGQGLPPGKVRAGLFLVETRKSWLDLGLRIRYPGSLTLLDCLIVYKTVPATSANSATFPRGSITAVVNRL